MVKRSWLDPIMISHIGFPVSFFYLYMREKYHLIIPSIPLMVLSVMYHRSRETKYKKAENLLARFATLLTVIDKIYYWDEIKFMHLYVGVIACWLYNIPYKDRLSHKNYHTAFHIILPILHMV